MALLDFFSGKRVLVTGHTGFKGSWLCAILSEAGAHVTGFSQKPPTAPSLFEVARIEGAVDSRIGDIRDFEHLRWVVDEVQPEIVLHLAAQPIVLEGYLDPRGTFQTNVMGTVNLLEALRHTGSARSIVNVTTDKVYLNREIEGYGYVEDDSLDGFDPYSNSKSCSDLATHCYSSSFFAAQGAAVSVARAGNVIGGGDFAPNRIIPDCVRAVQGGKPLVVRNPHSTRPYQHVLEPLFAYLLIAKAQWEDSSVAGAYNVGPDDCDCVSTGALVKLFAEAWGDGFTWSDSSNGKAAAPHEANYLKLSSEKLKRTLQWNPCWHIGEAVERTVDWTRAYMAKGDVREVMSGQISEFLDGFSGVGR